MNKRQEALMWKVVKLLEDMGKIRELLQRKKERKRKEGVRKKE